jgi:hypothetical protein
MSSPQHSDADPSPHLDDSHHVWSSNITTVSKNKRAFARNARHLTKRANVVVHRTPKTDVRNRYGKYWNPAFSRPRNCADHVVFHDRPEAIAATIVHENQDDLASRSDAESEQGDNLGDLPDQDFIPMLLGAFSASDAFWETNVLTKFLSQKDDEATIARNSEAWAWVDDREISAGRSRDYERSFSATDLRKTLEQEVSE